MTCIFRALFCVQCTNERTVFIHDNTRTWYIHVYAVVAAVYRWDIYVRYDLFFRDNLVPNLFIARIFLRTTCVAGIFCYVRPVGREHTHYTHVHYSTGAQQRDTCVYSEQKGSNNRRFEVGEEGGDKAEGECVPHARSKINRWLTKKCRGFVVPFYVKTNHCWVSA